MDYGFEKEPHQKMYDGFMRFNKWFGGAIIVALILLALLLL